MHCIVEKKDSICCAFELLIYVTNNEVGSAAISDNLKVFPWLLQKNSMQRLTQFLGFMFPQVV